MALVYDDSPYNGPPIPYGRINANASYLRHYENSLLLQWVLQHGNMVERHQASKELAIADRKMEYMQRHRNFDWGVVLPKIERLKRQWSRAKGPVVRAE